MALKPESIELEAGQKVQFQTALGDRNKLSWSITPAGLGTISQDGAYTAPAQIETPLSARISAITSEATPRRVTASVTILKPWQDASVGKPASPGRHAVRDRTYTVEGAGGPWAKADQFHFTYQKFSGDGAFIAKIALRAPMDAPVKRGAMIRTSLSPDAPTLFHGTLHEVQAQVSPRLP